MSTKAYVIVTNLPPSFKGNNFFYKLLKQQVGGGLLGAMIEDHSTIGLAVFDSIHSALAACKENIMFKGTKNPDGTTDVYTAVLRIVETEHEARAAESVYNDSITVEGAKVKKEDIDFTYGYQLALRGEQGAAWCHHTRNKESCPLSTKCKFIHLKEYQTSKKRLRGVAANHAASGIAEVEDRNVSASAIVGMPFLPPRLSDTIVITPTTAQSLLEGNSESILTLARKLLSSALSSHVDDGPTGPSPRHASTSGVTLVDLPTLVRSVIRIESELGGTTEADYFTETNEGLAFLKSVAKCILPPNGCPTPIERDAFIREMLKKRNLAAALLAENVFAGLDREGAPSDELTYVNIFAKRIETFLKSPNVRRQLSPDNMATSPIRIALQPRYHIENPTVQEMTFFMKSGIVTGITQHYDDVLAPSSLFEGEQTADLKEELHPIWDRVREVRSKLEQWASRSVGKASLSTPNSTPFANNRVTGPSFSGAVHVAFPSGVYSFDTRLEGVVGYPSSKDVLPTPKALLRNEENVSIETFGAVPPVVLGVKVFESAAAQNTLFNDTPAGAFSETDKAVDTRNTRPLWRRLRTSPTPLFPRSTIDKLSEL